MHGETSCESRSVAGPVLMIVVGCILLVGQFVPDMGFEKLWPLIPITMGAAMLLGRR